MSRNINKNIINSNVYYLLGVLLTPYFVIELLVFDLNLEELYKGVFEKGDPLIPIFILTSVVIFSYNYIEFTFEKDKIIIKKPYWFMNRYFEVSLDQIDDIKCYSGRGEFVDIFYKSNGKLKKKHFEFSTFKFKELKKIIDSLSTGIENSKQSS